jgi:hypothetical protein
MVRQCALGLVVRSSGSVQESRTLRLFPPIRGGFHCGTHYRGNFIGADELVEIVGA